jgi:hypothetical protein
MTHSPHNFSAVKAGTVESFPPARRVDEDERHLHLSDGAGAKETLSNRLKCFQNRLESIVANTTATVP